MRHRRLCSELVFRVSSEQRIAVERLSEEKMLSLGEAARVLLDLGIKASAGAET